MPIYEYRCNTCHRRITLFLRSFSEQPRCNRCGSEDLAKLVSRVAILRSEEGHLESLADPSNLAGLDEDDPKSLARWMRRMSSEVGEDLGGEFDEMVDRIEAGENPDEIEQSMGMDATAEGDGGI
ncbi:MAG: zinc ribbon domain-containing protein [Candidatus Latescibacteria bacterium]|nr:zinc ribbon domain-containing protein [Candidatus Latescibacterota bacterium]